jgi:hypothetical protein
LTNQPFPLVARLTCRSGRLQATVLEVEMAAQVGATPIEDRLTDIRSLTDAALSRLDDHDFLAELLDRTRRILGADTAAVLLLDYSAGQLIATAAAGLEEEVRQGGADPGRPGVRRAYRR